MGDHRVSALNWQATPTFAFKFDIGDSAEDASNHRGEENRNIKYKHNT